MEEHPRTQTTSVEAAARESREERLRRFRVPVEERDAEVIEHWRQASPEAHAQARIGLARASGTIVAHTGFGKDPHEMFPGFPTPLAASKRLGGRDGGRA
jgi:hypothetical protein